MAKDRSFTLLWKTVLPKLNFRAIAENKVKKTISKVDKNSFSISFSNFPRSFFLSFFLSLFRSLFLSLSLSFSLFPLQSSHLERKIISISVYFKPFKASSLSGKETNFMFALLPPPLLLLWGGPSGKSEGINNNFIFLLLFCRRNWSNWKSLRGSPDRESASTADDADEHWPAADGQLHNSVVLIIVHLFFCSRKSFRSL